MMLLSTCCKQLSLWRDNLLQQLGLRSKCQAQRVTPKCQEEYYFANFLYSSCLSLEIELLWKNR